MDEQNSLEQNELTQNPKNPWIIIAISVVATAIIIGGGVYAWQNSSFKSKEQSLQQQITILQNEVENLQKELLPKEIVQNDNKVEELKYPFLMTIQGIVKYDNKSMYLVDKEGNSFKLNLQETTKLKVIVIDEKINQVLEETEEDYPWFGLISDISDYIKEGQAIYVNGTVDFINLEINTEEIQSGLKTYSPETNITKTTEEKTFTYKNTNYNFELTFPETWGEIKDQELPGDEINLSSKTSLNRNIDIIMVGVNYKNTVVDTEGIETFYLGENDSIAFYARVQNCMGGPGCNPDEEVLIKNEVKNLANTFKNL